VHLVADGQGVPLAAEVSAGQKNECTEFQRTMRAVPLRARTSRRPARPKRLAGDKGYSSREVRDWLECRGIEPVIPFREDQKALIARGPSLDKPLYRQRNVIERCVGWLKECRRIATRFEKLAVNYLAMLRLAMIQRYLRILFSDTT
jgi:transposase